MAIPSEVKGAEWGWERGEGGGGCYLWLWQKDGMRRRRRVCAEGLGAECTGCSDEETHLLMIMSQSLEGKVLLSALTWQRKKMVPAFINHYRLCINLQSLPTHEHTLRPETWSCPPTPNAFCTSIHSTPPYHLLSVAPQMPMLPCNSCLTMCPTKCCHPMEDRGSEEEGGVDLRRVEWVLDFECEG